MQPAKRFALPTPAKPATTLAAPVKPSGAESSLAASTGDAAVPDDLTMAYALADGLMDTFTGAAAAQAAAPVAAVKPAPAAAPAIKPTLPPAKKPGFLPLIAAPAAAAGSKPAGSAPLGKSAKPKAAASKAGDGADAPAKVPRPPSAFMLFSASRRPGLKVEQPELTFGEIGKALGAEWAALDAAGKAPFVAEAAAKKAAAPSATPAKRAAGGAKKAKEDGPKKDTKFSGWMVFCAERRPQVKAEQPVLTFGDLTKAVAEEWKLLGAEAKAAFNAKAAERTAAAATGGSADGGMATSSIAPKAKRAKSKKAAESDSEDDIVYAEEEDEAVTEDVEGDDEDVSLAAPQAKQPSRRRDVAADGAVEYSAEWGCDRTQAVQFLLTRAGSGAYVAVRAPGAVPTLEAPVALRGMPAAPAVVDDEAAAAPDLVHSEDMEHDYEIAAAQFKAALAERSTDSSIDLDDLPEDSPLGSMVILEILRSKGGPLHEQALGRGKRNVLGCQDTLIKVPAVALSFIVQRLITCAVQADRASRGSGDVDMTMADADGGGDGGAGVAEGEFAE